MQTKEITSYSFFEFCRDAQEAVLQGYRYDFDSNERHPQMFGSMLTAIMVMKEEPVPEKYVADEKQESIKDELLEQTAEVKEDKPVVKLGRKPRG